MAYYKISLTDGGDLVLLNDGVVNTDYSISLIGKNVSNFGDAQNENFVHMLENFAHTLQPKQPLTGQIWYKKSLGVSRPLVFDGVNWRPVATCLYWSTTTDVINNAGGYNITASRPGDFWFDSARQQLHVVTSGTNTATQTVLVGPEGVPDFGITKFVSTKMFDNTGIGYPVIQMVLDGEVLAIISKTTFTQTVSTASGTLVTGFPTINRGITFKNYSSSVRYPTSEYDVVLYGLKKHLDDSYPRRNVNEHIQANWYVDSGQALNFGTSAESSIRWNSSLDIISTSSVIVTSQSKSLTFNGTSLTPSASIDLGSNTARFSTAYINTADVNSVVASSVNAGSITVGTISNTSISATSAQVTGLLSTVITATTLNVVNGNITNVVSGKVTSTDITATNLSAATAEIPNFATTKLTVYNTVTSTGTITANTFNGISFYGGNFYGDAFYENGSRVITAATVGDIEVNAAKLRGADGVNYYPASQRNIGNTIVQRHPNGAVTATSVEVGSLIATGGLSSSGGLIIGNWTLSSGSRLDATYADLAEKYLADADYKPGTVLEFGGEKEVTIATDSTRRVAGVVTSNPAYTMNSSLEGDHVVTIALMGRVPCKVRGKIRKGDMMVASSDGFARPSTTPILGSVIGKALEDFDGIEGVIEVVVGRL